jgi:uncharacterized protein involved in exopolysaccharide biosynthesis
MPKVEQAYLELSRDYQNALAKYTEVQAKKLEAEVSVSLESEQRSERFSLIEPPLQPEEPIKPNRWAISFLGLVLSLAGGLGSGALAEAMDPAIRGRRGVIQVLGVPPIASIPDISAGERRPWWKKKAFLLFLAVLVVVIVIAVLYHFLVRPLDVLWFRAMYKFT